MSRRPLWNASFVLAAAWLAVPAGALDVAAPTDLGPAPVGGGGAGASVSGAGNGVAVVPTLSAGLISPSAPLMAAPSAAPSAMVASPMPAAAAAAHAAPAAAPALAAHGVPAAAASALVPGAAPNASAKSAALNAENDYFSPKPGSAFGKAAPSAVGHEAAPSFLNEAAPNSSLADFLDAEKAKNIFDGSKTQRIEEYDFPSTRIQKPGVPALSRLTKAAASLGPEASGLPVVAPPTPPKVDPVDALADKLSAKLTGLWQKVKQGFGAKPPPSVLSPVVSAEKPLPVDPADPLENIDGILVHAPRALRFDALGYRVHFAPPDGAASEAVKDEAVRVRVRRGAGDAGTETLRARFAAFNSLIEANFAALELIAQSSSKMTVKTARLVAATVEEMAASYALMVGPENAVDTTADVAALGIGLDQAVKGLSDGDLLPPQAVALVMPLETNSLHFQINKLHQAALRDVGSSGAASPANLVVTLGSKGAEREVSLVDLSERPLVRGGRLVSPAFKALVEAMRRSKDQPEGALLLQDHQFWGHFQLGAHSAEVYANFLPPDEGGMLRVRYQEWGTGYDNQTRLYYVARLLQKAGFHVEQDNGFLTAVVDKDHASQSVDEMTDTFALVVQALHATVGVDFALPLLVQGAKTSAEVGARIDQWVDVVLGEGTLPFYVNDDHNAMVKGWSEYLTHSAARDSLRAGLNKTLARLGLPALPKGEVLGQRTIDRFVNAPVEAALARGELRLSEKGAVEKTKGYDPLAGVASSLTRDPAAGARLAEAVSSLDPGLLPFETVGSLGALNVERAERRLEPGEWLTVYALRDPRTGQIGLAQALVSDLKPGGSPREIGAAGLFSRLSAQGYPVAPFEPAKIPAGLDHFTGLLKSEPAVDWSMGRRAQGLAASPGHGRPVLAQVTYDKEKAARGGYVFVAPYTTPDDLDAIRASKAVITTSGGLLSHAAITTREMGIPAAILSRAEWAGTQAVFDSPQFDLPYMLGEKRGGLAARLRRPEAGQGAALAEGALVRLDPGTGAVEIFPQGLEAPLLAATAALERYDAGRDARALLSALDAEFHGASLSPTQKSSFARAALEGLGARAFARPDAAAPLATFYASLPKDGTPWAAWIENTVDNFFMESKRETLELLREKRGATHAAMSVEAVERALRAGEGRAARLAAVAAALGRPKKALIESDFALAALRGEAKSRGKSLLAADVAELQDHARLFPNATVEVLPRLKAAIAKAKRRRVAQAMVASWEK